jgi:hypothetical protein
MMNQQEKIALSEQVAKLYGVEEFSKYDFVKNEGIYLADDSARCFELAVDNSLCVEPYEEKYCFVAHFVCSQHTHTENYADHPSKQEATRISILKALVKLKGE